MKKNLFEQQVIPLNFVVDGTRLNVIRAVAIRIYADWVGVVWWVYGRLDVRSNWTDTRRNEMIDD